MSLPLKAEAIAALYEYLRVLPPFSGVKMPHADDVEFFVLKNPGGCAYYQWMGDRHRISVSFFSISQTITLLAYLGHEMIHLYLEEAGLEGGGNENVHNRHFRKLAVVFCKTHGLDPKAFF